MICLCLSSPRLSVNAHILKSYVAHVDLVEYRFDRIDPTDRVHFSAWASKQYSQYGIAGILTIRLPIDGGSWQETEQERHDWYIKLITELPQGLLGWIDVELDTDWPDVLALAKVHNIGIIRSAHDFKGTPPAKELASCLDRLCAAGDLGKFAAMVHGCNDQAILLAEAQRLRHAGRNFILVGMGVYGLPLRILAPKIGSQLSYTSAAAQHFPDLAPDILGPPAAPGHLDPRTLAEDYRYRTIRANTAVFGIVGNPVSHSRSPQFHNAIFQQEGIDARYIPFQVDDMQAFQAVANALDCQGLSVTIPHKEAALAIANDATVVAKAIGAANTLLRSKMGFFADNTDAPGFIMPLQNALGPSYTLQGKRVLVIGAGGAARAAIYPLLQAGALVVLANRTLSRADALALDFSAYGQIIPCTLESKSISEAVNTFGNQPLDLVVNTSSTGMSHSDSEGQDPLINWPLEGVHLVYDIIYTPEYTALLERAKENGCAILNGREMFETQAKLQSSYFLKRFKESQLL